MAAFSNFTKGFIQSANTSTTLASVTTVTKAFTNPVTAGSFLLTMIQFGTAETLTSVTDTLNNAYFPIGPFLNPGGAPFYLYYCITGASGANTVTWTFTPLGSPTVGLVVAEYSGIEKGNPIANTMFGYPSNTITTKSMSRPIVVQPGQLALAVGSQVGNNNYPITAPWFSRNAAAAIALADLPIYASGALSINWGVNGNAPGDGILGIILLNLHGRDVYHQPIYMRLGMDRFDKL